MLFLLSCLSCIIVSTNSIILLFFYYRFIIFLKIWLFGWCFINPSTFIFEYTIFLFTILFFACLIFMVEIIRFYVSIVRGRDVSFIVEWLVFIFILCGLWIYASKSNNLLKFMHCIFRWVKYLTWLIIFVLHRIILGTSYCFI